jgi:hypothetical protein
MVWFLELDYWRILRLWVVREWCCRQVDFKARGRAKDRVNIRARRHATRRACAASDDSRKDKSAPISGRQLRVTALPCDMQYGQMHSFTTSAQTMSELWGRPHKSSELVAGEHSHSKCERD